MVLAMYHDFYQNSPSYLRWTIHSTLWFREAQIREWWVYALVLTGLFLFTILFEGISAYKDWLLSRAQVIKGAQHAPSIAPAGYSPMRGGESGVAPPEEPYSRTITRPSYDEYGHSWYASYNWSTNRDDWAAATLHLLSWLLTYMLILAVVTGNIGFIVAILLGHLIGKILNIRRPMSPSSASLSPSAYL